MEAFILNFTLIAFGIYVGIRNIRLLRSEVALRDYMRTNPKAAFWVSKYGFERATQMAREQTIPLGIAIAAALISLGVWNLFRIYL